MACSQVTTRGFWFCHTEQLNECNHGHPQIPTMLYFVAALVFWCLIREILCRILFVECIKLDLDTTYTVISSVLEPCSRVTALEITGKMAWGCLEIQKSPKSVYHSHAQQFSPTNKQLAMISRRIHAWKILMGEGWTDGGKRVPRWKVINLCKKTTIAIDLRHDRRVFWQEFTMNLASNLINENQSLHVLLILLNRGEKMNVLSVMDSVVFVE